MILVKRVETKKELNDFTMLPFELYKDDNAWVPPLIGEFKKYVLGKDNALNQVGPNERVVAYSNGKIAGRLLVGINGELNEYKGYQEGYIALYECVDDDEVSFKLLEFAETFLKGKGINKIKGPLSLPGGDDYRGFLIDNFEDPTLVMNTFNKKYYNDQFLKYGMEKYLDCYAYKGLFDIHQIERLEKIIPYAMHRYKYTVDKLDLKNMEKEMMEIRQIIEKAMPDDWDDFMPPSEEETRLVAKQLLPFADPDFIYIARDAQRNPIGFNIALPDYNQVLKRMNGRMLPFGIFKFLYYRKKIDRLRIFVLFVIPEYRKKGVTAAIYYAGLKRGLEKGYKYAEGSTIWEYNKPMQNDVLGFTDSPYKTYRVYIKKI